MRTSGSALLARVVPPGAASLRRSPRLVERNLLVYRRTWLVIVSGVFEPLFYLLAVGLGVGHLVGGISGEGGRTVSYPVFVAPGLLASAAMNGAIYDSTFNVFHKLRFAKTYDAMLSTPVGVGDVAVGEVAWALLRGTLYAISFLVVMAALGLARSPWLVLALPGSVLIGFGFAGIGMAATTFMRSWQDFDLVQLVLLPLFLFSATFYPLSAYPGPVQVLVSITPLYRGIDLLRALNAGDLGLRLVGDAAYLAIMGLVGVIVAARRLGRLLLR
ncbi:MAG: ABC transporter permease [Acidimicrobiales bacterium]